MFWIPLIDINLNLTGIACPFPLQKEWKLLNYNKICKINGKSYKYSLNKIITTPSNYNTIFYNSFDPGINFTPLSGIKISLAGRLKGITKAKSLVINYGVINPQKFNKEISYYARAIYTKWGTIGLKVIC